MIDVKQSVIIIAVMSGVTILLRLLPYFVFSKHTPKAVLYLGNVLPYSIVAMLLIYCIRNVNLISRPYGIPEIVSILLVAIIHKIRHNTMLSIIVGTVCYMFLVQAVFA